jgi:hypothetical protein
MNISERNASIPEYLKTKGKEDSVSESYQETLA